jgi:hypothetical protein
MLRVQALLFAFSSLAFAQLDSLALRAKLGSPLHRETFHAAAGFDVIVDYSSGGRVCKLQVPALMPGDEKVSNTDVMRQRMHDFLIDVVPLPMRGLKLQSMTQQMGTVSLMSTEYENISIHEMRVDLNPFAKDNTITVVFKNEPCDR